MGLVIRDAQMAALREAARRDMVGRIVESLRPHFAGQFAVQGAAAVRAAAELAVIRAATNGLRAEREAFLYASLAFMLGSRFDVDPQLPWVGPLLAQDGPDGFARAQRTYDGAMDYLDRTAGPDGSAHVRVLVRLRKLDLDAATKQVDEERETGVVAVARKLHPRKAEYLGDEGVQRLWAAGTEGAARYGIVGPRGRLVHVLLMLMLGSAYDSDPQFPWAARALRAQGLDEAPRVEGLYRAAMDHLARSLAASGEGEG